MPFQNSSWIMDLSNCKNSARERLAKGRFFEGLQNNMENENDGNENKIILGDFNCTMDKMEKHCGNKIQTL